MVAWRGRLASGRCGDASQAPESPESCCSGLGRPHSSVRWVADGTRDRPDRLRRRGPTTLRGQTRMFARCAGQSARPARIRGAGFPHRSERLHYRLQWHAGSRPAEQPVEYDRAGAPTAAALFDSVASDPPGVCSETAGTVSCAIGRLAVGEGAEIQIRASVPRAASTLSNTASVSGDQPDPDVSNNSATAMTQVTLPEPRPGVLAITTLATLTALARRRRPRNLR